MNSIVSALKKLSLSVLPKRCEICCEVVELDELLCCDCKSLPMIHSPRCVYCGCSKKDCLCQKHKNEYKQIVAPYYYQDSIVRAVHNFKDNDMPFMSKRFSRDMEAVIHECYADITFDIIAYVPLRKFRELKRGYNQSKLLADSLSESLGIQCMPLLKKVRYTGVQHHKSEKQRKSDSFGAYDVDDKFKSQISDKTILLIDDVKTTGSTLNECAKMLNIYGAKAVYCAAFALTKKEKNRQAE